MYEKNTQKWNKQNYREYINKIYSASNLYLFKLISYLIQFVINI